MLVYFAKHRGYKNPRGWAAYKYRAKTKTKKEQGLWPHKEWELIAGIPPNERVLNWIHRQQQNYARSQNYAKRAEKKRQEAGQTG